MTEKVKIYPNRFLLPIIRESGELIFIENNPQTGKTIVSLRSIPSIRKEYVSRGYKCPYNPIRVDELELFRVRVEKSIILHTTGLSKSEL